VPGNPARRNYQRENNGIPVLKQEIFKGKF